MKWYRVIKILILSLFIFILSGCQDSHSSQQQAKQLSGAQVAGEPTDKVKYTLTAPPRESYEDGMKQYGPVAKYLSKVTGKNIVYVHQNSWMSYSRNLKRGDYDIIFDGPHFNVWRNRYLGHVPLARIDWPCTSAKKKGANGKCKTFRPKWMLVYRKGTNTGTLYAHKFCMHAPPNFGTLSLLYTKFPNASRQPYIMEMRGWKKMVRAVRDNKNGCEFTVSRKKHVMAVDPEGKVLAYKSFDAFVHQGFTARGNLPPLMIGQMRTALTSKVFHNAAQSFHKRFVPKGRVFLQYKDSPEYDKPLNILANGYLIPLGFLKPSQSAKR